MVSMSILQRSTLWRLPKRIITSTVRCLNMIAGRQTKFASTNTKRMHTASAQQTESRKVWGHCTNNKNKQLEEEGKRNSNLVDESTALMWHCVFLDTKNLNRSNLIF